MCKHIIPLLSGNIEELQKLAKKWKGINVGTEQATFIIGDKPFLINNKNFRIDNVCEELKGYI